jgi:hypothetical protein
MGNPIRPLRIRSCASTFRHRGNGDCGPGQLAAPGGNSPPWSRLNACRDRFQETCLEDCSASDTLRRKFDRFRCCCKAAMVQSCRHASMCRQDSRERRGRIDARQRLISPTAPRPSLAALFHRAFK